MSGLTLWQRVQITSSLRLEWYLVLAKLSKEGLPLYDTLKIMHLEFKRLGHPLFPLVSLVLLGLRGEDWGQRQMENQKQSQTQWLMQLQMQLQMQRPLSGLSSAQISTTRRRTLGSELRPHVPISEALLIEAGDMSGRLHLGLESAAQLLSQRLSLYDRVLKALLRPLGYGLLMWVLMLFLSLKILPEFERTRPKVNWPREALELAWVCDHVLLGSWIMASLLVVLGLGLMWFLPEGTPRIRAWLDRWIWPFQLYASFQGACFLLALSAFIQAGSGFTQAVQSIHLTATPYMAHQCKALLHALKMGKTPQVALCELSILHPKHHWLILVYGLSQDTPKAYERIAKEIFLSVDRWLMGVLGHVLGHVMLFLVGVMVCWIYWAMFEIVEATPMTF